MALTWSAIRAKSLARRARQAPLQSGGIDVFTPPEYSATPIPESVDHFVEDVVIRESGALCAFHYLFARYREWRVSFDLLASNLSEEQFAFAVQFHGIKADFDRKLFFDACARWGAPANPPLPREMP